MPDRIRNLAGTYEYPALIIFHEKHDNDHYVVNSDDEVRYIAQFKFAQRHEERWYPTVEEAEQTLKRDQGVLALREHALAVAPEYLVPRDEGYSRFDWEHIEREIENTRTGVKQSKDWLMKARRAKVAYEICTKEDPPDEELNAVWNFLHFQEGEYEGVTVQPIRPILPPVEKVDA